MNLNKVEHKLSVVQDLGNQIENKKEEAERELHRLEGETRGLAAFAEILEKTLQPHVDKDIEAGIYDENVAKFVRRYVTRASTIANEAAGRLQVARLQQQGKVDGLTGAVAHLKDVRDVEAKNLQLLIAEAKLLAAQGAGVEDVGRPAPGIKAQREAEVLAAQAVEAPKPKKAPKKKR